MEHTQILENMAEMGELIKLLPEEVTVRTISIERMVVMVRRPEGVRDVERALSGRILGLCFNPSHAFEHDGKVFTVFEDRSHPMVNVWLEALRIDGRPEA